MFNNQRTTTTENGSEFWREPVRFLQVRKRGERKKKGVKKEEESDKMIDRWNLFFLSQ